MAMIRPARASDAAGIARVYVDTWRDTYAGLIPVPALVGLSHRRLTQIWAEELARPASGQVVVIANDVASGIVGFGSCGRMRGDTLPYKGEVFTLYVLPDFQGDGIGRRMLGRLFATLSARGMNSAVIWVLAANPARFFYQTMGGKLTAVREQRFWGVDLREWAYGWTDLRTTFAPSGKRMVPRQTPARPSGTRRGYPAS
jgi:ribosomal protein S18 acetylase RimI-like enzyme